MGSRATRLLKLPLLLLILVFLGACSKDKVDEADTLSIDELYRDAKYALDNGNYERSVRLYKRLTARFPFGEIYEQAQLDLSYAQFKRGLHDDAISTVNRFIKTYPAHPKADYALYLRGLINFDRNRSYIDRLLPEQAGNRDTSSARSAFNDFNEMLRRYPDSAYAGDARQRMLFLLNDLAQYELTIGEYYHRRGAHVGAANRAKYIVENYQQSIHLGDALALLVRSYEALGQKDLADDSRRVLQATQPDHPFLVGAAETRRSWWRRLLF